MDQLQALWQVLQPYLAGQLRHLLTVFAGILIAKGALTADQEGAFITIMYGAIVWIAVGIWSWWQKDGQANALAAAHRAYDHLLGQLKKPPAPSVTLTPSPSVKP